MHCTVSFRVSRAGGLVDVHVIMYVASEALHC